MPVLVEAIVTVVLIARAEVTEMGLTLIYRVVYVAVLCK